MFLKLGTSGVAMFLIWAFFLLLLKDPDTQMTCNTPKIWPHFGCNKHIFRLFSSLLFYFAQRHRGTSCLGSEWDQGVRNKHQLVGFCRVRVLDAASTSSGVEEMPEEGMLSEAGIQLYFTASCLWHGGEP